MAFETNLVAIRWYLGQYEVVSATKADIDFAALRRKHQLIDVTESVAYADYAVVVSYKEFCEYLLPEPSSWTAAARAWYAALPEHVSFIMIHEAEWESGLGD